MSRPPRNRELERLVVDTLAATSIDAPARHQAWEVYADWLLNVGEPVGEWLAASLRADDVSEAAAPLRARLADIEGASRYRLVDLDLADLVEVPELARIAELTWERGFITRAKIHGRQFRAWDSELLGHTPDHLLDVILRSPSACMLHDLELDGAIFAAKGARHSSLAALLAGLDEDLMLRSLSFDAYVSGSFTIGAEAQAHLPELRALELRVHTLRLDAPLRLSQLRKLVLRIGTLDNLGALVPWLEDLVGITSLTELELSVPKAGDRIVMALIGSPLLDSLERLKLGHVTEAGALAICRAPERFAALEHFELGAKGLDRALTRALRELGCEIA